MFETISLIYAFLVAGTVACACVVFVIDITITLVQRLDTDHGRPVEQR